MSGDRDYLSWGRFPRAHQAALRLRWRDESLPAPILGSTVLPRGAGRSYGDSCLNHGATLLDLQGLDRLLAFDSDSGVLRCEAGVLLKDILARVVPRGWFLPVTPGTQYVTVGGAIANDVHGKNHHVAGTWGRHLLAFELLRTDGRRLLCSPEQNADWFAATIGGLGLTGVILWADIRLRRIANPYIDTESVKFHNLVQFFELSQESDQGFEHCVSWIDCASTGKALGRGLFNRGNFVAADVEAAPKTPSGTLSVPVEPPMSLVNSLTLRAFNTLYYHRQRREQAAATVHYQPFFYPLDALLRWNRIYGPRGFLQWQCVVPPEDGHAAIAEILSRVARSGAGSFLAVVKVFGSLPSPGLLSFPRPGVTLALDFPNRGERTMTLLAALDEVVDQAAGAIYPAKDARMAAASFRRYFPRWQELEAYRDPGISSSFWRRVTED